jgi:uncharacterized protein YukE
MAAVVPSDYSEITMTVSPTMITQAATIVEAAVTEIVNCLNSIDDTLGDLKLGWDGNTAAEAHDFTTKWTAAMTQMFGTKGNASSGVLNLVIFGLKSAANNYDAAETGIINMFSTFGNAFAPTGQSGDSTAVIPAGNTIADGTLTAVSETDWSSIPA